MTDAQSGRTYHSELRLDEHFWVDQQPFLLSRGYRLRPRYDPAWIPSWTRPSEKPLDSYLCEDSTKVIDNVLDAIRIHDGIKVVLKRVPATTDEIGITLHLSSAHMRSDPRNRTVHILDVIPIRYDDEEYVFLVMPYLREFDSPPFHCRSEFVEALRQLLLGLEFMHEQNISHGDVGLLNLMMDETRVVPKRSHFVRPYSHDGTDYNLTWHHRCRVAPVDYYYIDFGLSGWYPYGHDSALAIGVCGQIKTVPELSDMIPYNPFKVDIYQLGYTILEVVSEYRDLQMFKPLAEAMMSAAPSDRPTASSALAQFETIASSIKRRKLRIRIWRKNDTLLQRFLRYIVGVPVI
ncbi:hypothetical protein PILCRDRAFT_255096 [Piloderma croceum F 1598]|uniref:Protein kinase domain-containing protein n=1 Tax=Piloderma croceum (strain F 1598) TaxID=765440 RepID=A0A0C3CF39_PILCF|nr:hypothetical protein PILCRDRAFT_255096 [Piloderma croceum F 1598]